jgi:D-glycero-D-manno-heptose 1,7-bisphosphate phosphatase
MTVPSAAFVDRDGTLNVKAAEGDYIRRAADLELLPGVAAAVRRLNDAGVPVFVITNQRGVSRGLMSEQDLDDVHLRLAELLGEHGAHIDAIYTCVHGAGECDCRKPLPGMLLDAARDHHVDLGRAVMVGDAAADVAAGRAAGTRTIRLSAVPDDDADATMLTLSDAVAAMLEVPAG